MSKITYLELNKETPKDTVINITEDTTIDVVGTVIIKQILVQKRDVNIIINGDTLRVINPDEGICVGVDGHFGLSYGRWTTRGVLPFVLHVQCHEFETRSKTPNVSIGTFGVSTNEAVTFAPTCIYNDCQKYHPYISEVLKGSTKYSARPQYITKEEIALKENKTQEQKLMLLGRPYTPVKMIEDIIAILSDYEPLTLYNYLIDVFDNADDEHKGRALISIYSACMIAFDKTENLKYVPDVVAFFIFANFNECRRLNALPRLTLAARLLALFGDSICEIYLGEVQMDPLQYNAIADIHLNAEIEAIYHLPDSFRGGPFKRFFYGCNSINWPEDADEIITGDLETKLNSCFYNDRVSIATSGDLRLDKYLQPTAHTEDAKYFLTEAVYNKLMLDIKLPEKS